MESEKFLPIGSVVLLKEGTKELMITGYCTVPEEFPDEIYDYSGCLYPEGVISSDEIYIFNHDQIKEIKFTGYKSDEQKEFMEGLTSAIENISNSESNIDSLDTDSEEDEDEDDDEDEEQPDGLNQLQDLIERL